MLSNCVIPFPFYLFSKANSIFTLGEWHLENNCVIHTLLYFLNLSSNWQRNCNFHIRKITFAQELLDILICWFVHRPAIKCHSHIRKITLLDNWAMPHSFYQFRYFSCKVISFTPKENQICKTIGLSALRSLGPATSEKVFWTMAKKNICKICKYTAFLFAKQLVRIFKILFLAFGKIIFAE